MLYLFCMYLKKAKVCFDSFQPWECRCIKGYTGPLCDIPINNTINGAGKNFHLELTRGLHEDIKNAVHYHNKNIGRYRKEMKRLGLEDLSLFIFPVQK